MNTQKCALPILLCGPSGVGKGTVCRQLLDRCPDMQLSISYTTRSPRAGEREGEHYFYVDQARFDEMVQEEAFLEYMRVHGGKSYGTPKANVAQHLASGRDVLLEIDVCGALEVKRHLPQAVMIFLLPPSMAELKRRLWGRGTEPQAACEERFRTSQAELEVAPAFEYLVVNDQVESAVAEIIDIIACHKRRTEHRQYLLDALKKEIQQGDLQ